MGEAYQMAWELFRRKRYRQAGEQLVRELAQHPNHAPSHGLLALCLVSEARWKEARQAAERAIQLAPDLPFAHYSLAWVFFKDVKYACRRGFWLPISGQQLRLAALKEAEKHLREALRLQPREACYFGLLAFIYHDRGKRREALAIARTGLEIDPTQTDCLRVQALMLGVMGKLEDAQEASKTALTHNPESATEHVIHGRTLLLAGQFDRALEHFVEAMRIDPNLPGARSGLLDGLRARNRVYRWLLWMQTGFRVRSILRQLRSLLIAIVLVLLTAVPPVVVATSLRLTKTQERQIPFFAFLAMLPGLLVLFSGWWVYLPLQFDPVGKHLVTPRQRFGVWYTVVIVLVLYAYFGFYAFLPPGPAEAATWVFLTLLPLWIFAYAAGDAIVRLAHGTRARRQA